MKVQNEMPSTRAASSQSLLRDVNDRLLDAQRRHAASSLLEFVCECSRSECQSSLALTAAEYEAVRSGGDRFVVEPGHEAAAFERIAEVHERVTVVAKIGAGRGVARRLDRRRLRFTGVLATPGAGRLARPVG